MDLSVWHLLTDHLEVSALNLFIYFCLLSPAKQGWITALDTVAKSLMQVLLELQIQHWHWDPLSSLSFLLMCNNFKYRRVYNNNNNNRFYKYWVKIQIFNLLKSMPFWLVHIHFFACVFKLSWIIHMCSAVGILRVPKRTISIFSVTLNLF